MLLVLLVAVVLLAWSNGANDNFKGVATLYGSGAASRRGALTWATVTTLAGSLVAVFVAGGLVRAFSGKGIVPEHLVGSPRLLAAVAVGAGATVLLATRLGLPTSTTHALMGALLGVGLSASASSVPWSSVASGFALPLLASPLIAATLTGVGWPVSSRLRRGLGLEESSCVCVSEGLSLAPERGGPEAVARSTLDVSVGDERRCRARHGEDRLAVRADRAVGGLHWLSGGAVCFSRAVNDTPKIAALLLVAVPGRAAHALLLIAAAMTLGGVLQSRRVAETMGRRITEMNAGQGLIASLATSSVVLLASFVSLPVSTTHVSCGALFGIGTVSGQARWATMAQVLAAWVTTLPLAAVLAAGAWAVLGAAS